MVTQFERLSNVRISSESFSLVICTFIAKGEEPDAGKQLIGTMETLTRLATEAIPLANEEFPLLDAKFKGHQYNTLVAWLRTPVEKASGIPENNRKYFSGWVEQGRQELVAAIVLETIDQLRGVDGVLLPEALAGSARQERLLKLYVKEEATLTHLSMTYQTWLTSPQLEH